MPNENEVRERERKAFMLCANIFGLKNPGVELAADKIFPSIDPTPEITARLNRPLAATPAEPIDDRGMFVLSPRSDGASMVASFNDALARGEVTKVVEVREPECVCGHRQKDHRENGCGFVRCPCMAYIPGDAQANT